MVIIITKPPKIVSIVGCSLITSHTQIGPIIVSRRKNKFTSAAVINLGAIVTRTKGRATHITHIKGTIIISFSTNSKLSTKKKANIATQSLPATAEGTRSTFLAYLARLALTAKPRAVMKPKISPRKFPNSIES